MRLLGIETSCDETAAAVVERTETPEGAVGTILSNVVFSQIDEHAIFGGVVPELAARAHVDRLDAIIAEALRDANVKLADLDGIAATAGPGLIGGVMVGLMTGKALALASGKPLVAVNHLEGHALTPRLTDRVAFPYLMLLVSGGHSQFVAVDGLGHYTRMGTTIDDALGEAFDKTAKMLGLPYPGGPALEARAKAGDPTRFDLPRPLRQKGNLDFSFSGLKTAVRQAATAIAPLSERDIDDLAASFQAAVADVVEFKATQALARFAETRGLAAPVLVPAGGVAANGAVRAALARAAEVVGGRVVLPPMKLCTDNGAMIAWAGAERLASGDYDGMEAPARPRWPLDATAPPKLGSGRLGAKA
jgi:N6-L-threonylcarbamoyladenine synthase